MNFESDRLFALIRGIEPDPAAFTRSIAPELSDDLLGEIARSDWGNGVEENLAQLIAIRESGRVSTIGYADPQEVLSLCHWTELAIDSERRRHLIRAFCAAALLQLADQPEGGDLSCDWLYFSYAQSAIALGYEHAHAALRSIAATIAAPMDIDEFPNYGVAALALLAATAAKRAEIASIVPDLIAWVSHAPSFAPLDCSPDAAAKPLDLSTSDHASDRCRWRELAQQVAVHAASGWLSSGPNRIILPVSLRAPLAKMLAEFAERIR